MSENHFAIIFCMQFVYLGLYDTPCETEMNGKKITQKTDRYKIGRALTPWQEEQRFRIILSNYTLMASSSIEQSDKIPMFRGKIVEGEGGERNQHNNGHDSQIILTLSEMNASTDNNTRSREILVLFMRLVRRHGVWVSKPGEHHRSSQRPVVTDDSTSGMKNPTRANI